LRLFSLRLILSLIVGITLVSLAFSYYEVRSEKRRMRSDLERRAEVLGESLAGNIEPRLEKGSPRELQRLVERFGNREHLDGVAIYDKSGASIAVTPGLAQGLTNQPAAIARVMQKGRG
jgi:trehalose 6-phosphate synthase